MKPVYRTIEEFEKSRVLIARLAGWKNKSCRLRACADSRPGTAIHVFVRYPAAGGGAANGDGAGVARAVPYRRDRSWLRTVPTPHGSEIASKDARERGADG